MRNTATSMLPYASRLRRIDGCFPYNFVQALKTKGIYDNSIVVLTADHGDSLGEQGRWGHAYTIFPEIMRVPLIIHLPKGWSEKYQSNPEALAFNSDVTPSLYYLLGHRPIQNSELLGKPLFTERREELNAYKHENYLVSSSYAAVYGVLSNEGRFLYTADAVNLKESWFDLSEAQPMARSVTSSMRVTYEKMIREKIELIELSCTNSRRSNRWQGTRAKRQVPLRSSVPNLSHRRSKCVET